jgi:hypothetical protein
MKTALLMKPIKLIRTIKSKSLWINWDFRAISIFHLFRKNMLNNIWKN